jgi:hypothetical protein
MTTETLPNGGTFEITGTRPAKHGFTEVSYRFAVKRIKLDRSFLCKAEEVNDRIAKSKAFWGRPYDEVYETVKYQAECKNRERGWK